jgi:flavodoxin
LKSLILCFSYHHNNTEKVAKQIAGVISAEIKSPLNFSPSGIVGYDLIGLGSGIYFGKHHKTLLDLADKLPSTAGQKVFIFSTSGQPNNSAKFHKKLKQKLETKGYNVTGEFNCPGYDTYAFLKLTGGIQKGHPDEQDLKLTTEFAEGLVK